MTLFLVWIWREVDLHPRYHQTNHQEHPRTRGEDWQSAVLKSQIEGEWGVDPASIKNLFGAGIKRVATSKGRSIDAMAEALADMDTQAQGEQGVNEFGLTGQTSDDIREQEAQRQEAQRQQREAQNRAQADAEVDDSA